MLRREPEVTRNEAIAALRRVAENGRLNVTVFGWRGVFRAVAATCLVALSSCSHQSDHVAGELHRSIGGEPGSLDPQRAGDTFSFEVLRDLFEGLTSESPTGETIPGAAESWTVSDSGLTYRFHLRADLRWSNGDPLTSGDFVRGFRRAVDPSTRGPSAGLLSVIQGSDDIGGGRLPVTELAVRAPDDATLEIDLRVPAPYFAAILSNSVAYPAHAAPGTGMTDGKSPLISNGAYRLVDWTPGAAIVLERNPFYWDAPNVAIRRVTYVALADSNAELTRYRAGQIDMTSLAPAQLLDSLRKERPGELQIRSQLAVVYYAFNLTDGPLARASGVREALTLAIDREQLVSAVLRGGQEPAYRLVPPGVSGYEGAPYAWRSDAPSARLERARSLLRKAGFSAAHPLRLRLLCPEDDTLRKVALAVTAMWHEALGVETEPTFLEYRAFLAARAARGAWDVLSHGWNADYPDPGNFLGIFTSGSPQNDARLADAAFDGLMARAGAEAGGAERLALLASAENRLLDDYAMAPIYYAVSRRLVSPRIQGAILSPMDHNYSKYLSIR